ncbi:hypothetical protein T10_11669, partial [Trichinella papuae]
LAYKMEKKAVLKKRSAEETKPIPAIYDEEAFAASAQPSTSGHFPLFKREKFTMYNHRTKRYPKLPQHRRDLQIPVNLSGQRRPVMNFCCGRVHRGTYWYLLRVPTLDCWHPCEPGAWMVLSRLYHNGINNCLPSIPLRSVNWCQQSMVYVRVKTLAHTDFYSKL